MKKIGVIGIENNWSSEKLADAVYKLTGFRLLIDMDNVLFDLESGKVYSNGIDLSTLDAIIIKKIGPDYSADLIDRLEILRYLNEKGLKIFSKPEKIIRLIDRLSCTVTLRLAGIPIPSTVITENINIALDTVNKFEKAVFKPLYTSKARGMEVIDSGNDALIKIEAFKSAGNTVLYIQKFLNIPEQDYGIVFLGGEYIGAYARFRQNDSWNTTINSGGKYLPFEPTREMLDLAYKAQSLFGLDFTCVDIVETEEGLMTFEVSAFGGFRGLKETGNINAGELYADFALRKLENES